MKKLISVLLLISLLGTLLCGCGKNREMYNANLTKYITPGEYKGFEIDTKGSEYIKIHKELYDEVITNNLVEVTDGVAALGDLVVIDYVGKKDGVPFDRGSAEKHELELGSNSFIEGFETAIVGHKFGTSFDINLTFPTSYLNEELAGEDVVFEIKLHCKKAAPEVNDAFAQKLGFANVAAFEADLKDRALKQFCFSKVAANFKTTDYPEKELEVYYQSIVDYYTAMAQSYNITFADFLMANNVTEEQFKNQMVTYQIKPSMQNEMYLYYILDKEKLEISNDKINELIKEAAEAQNQTVADLKKSKQAYVFEVMAVKEIVLDYLVANAVIK